MRISDWSSDVCSSDRGCGKSVTALALMGLLPSPPIEVVAGRAFFEGQNLLGLAPRRMGAIRGDRIAMIFQEPMTSLNPVYRIGDQIAEVVLRHRAVSDRKSTRLNSSH